MSSPTTSSPSMPGGMKNSWLSRLQGLIEIDLDFDMGITGFSIAEIDGLIEGLNPEDSGDPKDERMPADPR